MVVGGVVVGGCYLQNVVSFLLNNVNTIFRQDLGPWEKMGTLSSALLTFLKQPINWTNPKVAWACSS